MKRIIGYGSLLSKESAENTYSIENFQYGYIKNYSRIFNKLGYNIFENKYNENSSMLNIQEDKGVWLIISFFDIADKDYTKMRQREWDYHEVEVDIYNLEKEKVSQGIVFISKEYSVFQGEKVQLLHKNIKPEKRYIDLCINAVKKTPYFNDFLKTTYDSTGENLINIED